MSESKNAADDRLLVLTPHDIDVYDSSGKTRLAAYKASGKVVRLASKPQKHLFDLKSGVKVHQRQVFQGLDDMPEIDASKYDGIIVSDKIGEYFVENGRKMGAKYYVYGPDTSPEGGVRGPGGSISGTKRLVLYYAP